LQIDSGAAVNLTGLYAANNINREFAGLTGAGVLYGGGGTVTVNKASGTDTFSGDIQGAQGLIKDGAGTLARQCAGQHRRRHNRGQRRPAALARYNGR
jgi:hypothetical protein